MVIVIPVLVVGIWHLTKSFNLHHTHEKSNRQTLVPYFEKQNNWQTIIGQKFHRGQEFRLTPGRFFRNPVRTRSGSEMQNPVGTRSGNRIMFNTRAQSPLCCGDVLLNCDIITISQMEDPLWSWFYWRKFMHFKALGHQNTWSVQVVSSNTVRHFHNFYHNIFWLLGLIIMH